MCTDDNLFAEVVSDQIRDLLKVERALAGLLSFYYAGSKMNDFKFSVKARSNFIHQGQLGQNQTGTIATMAQNNQLQLVIFVACKLTFTQADRFQALLAGDTKLILNTFTIDYCRLRHRSLLVCT